VPTGPGGLQGNQKRSLLKGGGRKTYPWWGGRALDRGPAEAPPGPGEDREETAPSEPRGPCSKKKKDWKRFGLLVKKKAQSRKKKASGEKEKLA